MLAEISPGWGVLQSLISAASGLLGVLVGTLMTARNQKKERKNAHFQEQLKSFYSPLIGMKSEIRAKSALRKSLHQAAAAAWPKPFQGLDDPTEKKALEDSRWPKYEKLNTYTENQVRDELIPLFQKMLSHFSTNMWLAEASTREHYSTLTDFVELWNRHLQGAIPPDVVKLIDKGEVSLEPLYADLERNFARLALQLRK